MTLVITFTHMQELSITFMKGADSHLLWSDFFQFFFMNKSKLKNMRGLKMVGGPPSTRVKQL